MDYKRLTNNNRDEYDPEYDFCCDCKYFGEPCGCNRQNGTCGNYDRFLETYNRLAELEDKIENGTFIELPRNKIKIRDDKDADWNSQNFPKGSGGPYDYDYKGEEYMKNYKRLTFKISKNASNASYDELLDRLAELEDKIENGTLVEIESPCTEEELERKLIHIEIQNMIHS